MALSILNVTADPRVARALRLVEVRIPPPVGVLRLWREAGYDICRDCRTWTSDDGLALSDLDLESDDTLNDAIVRLIRARALRGEKSPDVVRSGRERMVC